MAVVADIITRYRHGSFRHGTFRHEFSRAARFDSGLPLDSVSSSWPQRTPSALVNDPHAKKKRRGGPPRTFDQ